MDTQILKQFLRSGVILENKVVQRTKGGVPQGGVISPIIANMVLDGLEAEIYQSLGRLSSDIKSSVKFIRYADDFIVTGPGLPWVFTDRFIPAITRFLAVRGLEINLDKTTLVRREEGFNFLG